MTKKKDSGSNDSGNDEEMFDPSKAVDAGNGEEMQEADAETKVVLLRKVENRARIEDYLDDVRKEPNIVERGKKLLQGNLVTFPDTKKTTEGYLALNCDKNRLAAFDALFGDGEGRPHIDTFCGRLVDWKGEVVDDRYSMVKLLDALHAMGLRQQSLESIRKSFRDWGLQVKTNDLIIKFNARIPEWDGKSRLEEKMIDLFKCFDTPLNRAFGKYFWLSLYCRITEPGCMAPMALSLFGAQDAGKSYFSKLICRVLQGDPDASPVQLDMDSNKIDFLRSITGASIIANIGEMTGFSRADLNDIKQFMTITSDGMHQKFEGHYQQKRQWISVLDGNKYEGLQRDETGNRRFYPVFVGQIPDVHGQPAWAEEFKVDFTGFDDDLLQIMAECREWLVANDGIDGYHGYVDSVSKDVKAFSRDEMSRGRGVVMDYTLDTYLIPCLLSLGKLNATIVEGRKNRGVWITTAAIKTRIKTLGRGAEMKENHLRIRMISLGATPELIQNVRGYLFKDVMTEGAYMERIKGGIEDDIEKIIEQFRDDGEF